MPNSHPGFKKSQFSILKIEKFHLSRFQSKPWVCSSYVPRVYVSINILNHSHVIHFRIMEISICNQMENQLEKKINIENSGRMSIVNESKE